MDFLDFGFHFACIRCEVTVLFELSASFGLTSWRNIGNLGVWDWRKVFHSGCWGFEEVLVTFCHVTSHVWCGHCVGHFSVIYAFV